MAKLVLALDFDGVLHGYQSGWQGADVIPDPPVPGAMAFLVEAIQHFDVHIFSSRSGTAGGLKAMQRWLESHMTIHAREIGCIDPAAAAFQLVHELVHWPLSKPPAFVGIDDRVLTFTGQWPSMQQLQSFKPWNKP